MEHGLRKRLNPDDYGINLILSRCTEDMIVDGKKNVLWQHLNYNEPLTQGMMNKFFTRAIDAFVYVSHWQHEKFRYVYHIPVDNAYVIKNAIEPIEYVPKLRDEKFRLIYTSAPFRGLEQLLDSFEILNRDDTELHVYSSTIIYGSGYDERYADQYRSLFERAANTKNVVYHGYAPNNEVIKALQQAHVFAYPSMFEETCCLAMIEAGAAGCSLVGQNLGSLAETGSEFATLVPIRIDNSKIAQAYAKALDSTLNSYWDNEELRQMQSRFFNHYYSWDEQIKRWRSLFESLHLSPLH